MNKRISLYRFLILDEHRIVSKDNVIYTGDLGELKSKFGINDIEMMEAMGDILLQDFGNYWLLTNEGYHNVCVYIKFIDTANSLHERFEEIMKKLKK